MLALASNSHFGVSIFEWCTVFRVGHFALSLNYTITNFLVAGKINVLLSLNLHIFKVLTIRLLHSLFSVLCTTLIISCFIEHLLAKIRNNFKKFCVIEFEHYLPYTYYSPYSPDLVTCNYNIIILFIFIALVVNVIIPWWSNCSMLHSTP